VLREVAAKRAILALHQECPEWRGTCETCLSDRREYAELWCPDDWPCATLRALAAVYSDHPDYDSEWK
jgi:hypothetical protein